MGKTSHLKSMTAYGRAESSLELGHITVELTSLNRRHLEISCSLPRLLNHFEVELRKLIGKRVARGHINLSIFLQHKESSAVRLTPHLSLVKELHQGWKQIAELTALPLSLELLQNSGYPLFIEESLSQKISIVEIEKVLQAALDQLIAMREKEGQALGTDLKSHVERLHFLIAEIEKDAPLVTEKYRTRLTEKMRDLFSEVDERIIKEIALLAEKVDISEEIVRFKSHLEQFSSILEGSHDVKGKTLDFLSQELMREINTIGSKSSSLQAAKWVIESKSEIEKMREQVQNVE